jgi:hypothetical protein
MPLGSGCFGLLKFKIQFEAFKSWAFITGLKICKNLLAVSEPAGEFVGGLLAKFV